jgi:hypothetical protein
MASLPATAPAVAKWEPAAENGKGGEQGLAHRPSGRQRWFGREQRPLASWKEKLDSRTTQQPAAKRFHI